MKTKTRNIGLIIAITFFTISLFQLIDFSLFAFGETGIDKPLIMQYDNPAPNSHIGWGNYALPLGNGNMGAMVFGRTDTERVQMNEKTLWTGGLGGTDEALYTEKDSTSDAFGNTKVEGAMDKYIEYLFENFYGDLENINADDTYPQMEGDSKTITNNRIALGNYQNFAEMYIDYNQYTVTNYRRQLDLRAGKTSETYTYNGVDYTREMFVSYPNNIMVYKVSASENQKISLTLHPEIPDLGTKYSSKGVAVTKKGNVIADRGTQTIDLSGSLDNNGMKFFGEFKIINDCGEVSANNTTATINKVDTTKGSLTVENANSVTILISLATNYKNVFPYYRQDDADYAQNYVTENMKNAVTLGYEQLAQQHYNDYNGIFSRVDLDLGGVYDKNQMTGDMKKEWYNTTNTMNRNKYLEEMFFQYGRYLTIAGSREDTLPTNLQGIWNDQATPTWQSDYHTNINLQMNYWPTYVGDMPESGLSLVKYITSLVEPGQLSAQRMFGTTHGWFTGTSNNPLGFTGAGNSSAMMGGCSSQAFLLLNSYDYYQYTNDKEVLEQYIYPAMKEGCLFFFETLQSGRQEWDKDKLYVAPSYSSEHGPYTIAAYYEQQLVYLLFQDTLEAAKVLNYSEDTSFISTLEEMMPKLDPISIGLDGQIKEYQHEGKYLTYTNGKTINGTQSNHRHNSNLIALNAGNLITTETPEYMEAAKVVLTKRGDGATGWSMGQKMNMWARLRNSEKSYTLFSNLMKPSLNDTKTINASGTAENFFDFHPPFQIDGNYGGCAGIAEMLMQSYAGYIDLLPSLPAQWAEKGEVKGFVGEGNFKLNYTWQNGKINKLSVLSRSGNQLKIKAGAVKSVVDSKGNAIHPTYYEDGSIGFETVKGETYTFTFVSNTTTDLQKLEAIVKKWGKSADKYYLYEDGEDFLSTYTIAKKAYTTENYCEDGLDALLTKLENQGNSLTIANKDKIYAGMTLSMLNSLQYSSFSVNKTLENHDADYWSQGVDTNHQLLKTAYLTNKNLKESATSALTALNDIENCYAEKRKEVIELLAKLENKNSLEGEAKEYIKTSFSLLTTTTTTEEEFDACIQNLYDMESGKKIFISISANEGGTYTPSETQLLDYGNNFSFTSIPDSQHYIYDITVNGDSIGNNSTYNFEKIIENLVIEINFKQKNSENYNKLKMAIEKAQEYSEEQISSGWTEFKKALDEAKSESLTDIQAGIAAQNLIEKMNELTYNSICKVEAEAGRTGELSNSLPTYLLDGTMDALGSPLAWNFDWTSTTNGLPTGIDGITGNPEIQSLLEAKLQSGFKTVFGYGATGMTISASGQKDYKKYWYAYQSNSKFSGNLQYECAVVGAWALHPFNSPSIRYIAEKANVGSMVAVYIDGKKIAEIDMSSKTSGGEKQIVGFDSADYVTEINTAGINLNDGKTHILFIQSIGTGEISFSNSYPTYSIFRVDAFEEESSISNTINYTSLINKIAISLGMLQENYSALQVRELAEYIEAAKTYLTKQDATQQEINNQVELLNNKISLMTEIEFNVDSINSLSKIVTDKTDISQISLPNSVLVTLYNADSNTTMIRRVNVLWNKQDEVLVTGDNKITGSLDLPQGYTNLNNKFVNINVFYSPNLRYQLTINGGSGSGEYSNEQDVVVVAEESSTKVFYKWNIEGTNAFEEIDLNSPNLSFKMPTYNITLTAIYKKNIISVDIDNKNPKVGDVLTAIMGAEGAKVNYIWKIGENVVGIDGCYTVKKEDLGQEIKLIVAGKEDFYGEYSVSTDKVLSEEVNITLAIILISIGAGLLILSGGTFTILKIKKKKH